jgi:ligand-binding SRPBCC domain-containing protein
MEYALERAQIVPVGVEEAFAFFGDPWNLEAITPSWLRFRIETAPERLEQGSELDYSLRVFGWPIRWHTEITAWHPPRGFRDVQRSGPYPLWEHTHRLTPAPGGTEIYDHVRYRLPGGPLAGGIQCLLVGRWLDRIFAYRAARIGELLG